MVKGSRDRTEKRVEAETAHEKKEGGFQTHSGELTGANHGKLDQIFRLCDFNTQTRAYITMLNKCWANALYNLL